jgi:long-chain acyl-CoA synthetase
MQTMNANLITNLTTAASSQPDAPALIIGSKVTSYRELDEASARVAGLLASRGLGPGDRVGIMLPNIPEFALIYYGVLRAGGVVVPMNPLLKEREVSFYLTDADSKLLFVSADFASEALPTAAQLGVEAITVEPDAFASLLAGIEPSWDVAELAEDDTAVVLYTSGTTGRPKGAQLTHAGLRRNAEVTLRTLLEAGPDDVILGALPLFHVFGQTCGLNAAIASGASLALVPRFSPDAVFESLERNRVTVFEGVPTMFAALLHDPGRERYDLSALRVCVSGGAALPVEVLHGFEQAFGATVLEGYGLSETSPVACFNHPDRERMAGSIGTPIEGVEMRVVGAGREPVAEGERGEIAIRGHNVMKGYLNRPEATAEAIDDAGWFYTGDIGRVDEQGRYYIVDRKKELIIRGGYNVYPREIEEVLYEHPAVREAAVIGIPHASLGEEVAAAVALKADSAITAEELKGYVKSKVAAYKYPRHLWLVDELPKGSTGKILKREIEVPAEVAGTDPR